MTDLLDEALAAHLGRSLYDTINKHLADGQRAEQERDGAYRERAHLVAHLAALYPAHIGYTDPNAIDWLVVTIETPAGQMSWHIAERDRDLFEHVKLVPASHNVWDGHTTEQKYERLRVLTAEARSAEAFVAFVADTIADHEGDEWADHGATTAIRAAITRHATGQQPGLEETARWLHVTFTNPDPYTANRAALSLVDWLNAEFPSIGMRIDTNATEPETDTTPADTARARYAQAVARVESSGPRPEAAATEATSTPDTITDPEWLRQQYAAAIWERQNPGRRWADCEYRWRADAEEDADAVLAVRDREMDRMKLLVAASESPGHAVRMAAQYADKAIENGERAEQLARTLAVVLGEFRILPGTRTATAHVETETIDRWRAVVDQTTTKEN